MYRTATGSAYDVMDTVMCNMSVREYPDMPGTCETRSYVVSAYVESHGDDRWEDWLVRALTALLESAQREARRSGETAGPADGVTSE
jgi:hypothetical protein